MTSGGRNDPCPCGSGLKYKKCCLPKEGGTSGLIKPALIVLILLGSVAALGFLVTALFQSGQSRSEFAVQAEKQSMREERERLDETVRAKEVAAQKPASQAEIASIREERTRLDETVWAKETAAQQYEQTIVKYWDQMLRPDDDKYAVFASVPFDWISFGKPVETVSLDWGIKRTHFGGEVTRLDPAAWQAFLAKMSRDDYRIINVEFHQSRFDMDDTGTARSMFSVELHAANPNRTHRWVLKANLNIEWSSQTDNAGRYLPRTIQVTDLTVLEREAPADTFKTRLTFERIIDQPYPVLYDLNQDGHSEIVLPSNNTVVWNVGRGTPKISKLVESADVSVRPGFAASIIADFTNDGHADLLTTAHYTASQPLQEMGGPAVLLFRGDPDGHFRAPGEPVHTTPLRLASPVCITAGDIDGDNDLDIWLAQYKAPYNRGQMPTPFYDANDGYPSYLLINEGNGRFVDATEAAGLDAKRYRRTYSASFVDLDEDLDLDLLVVNDFAGIDIYYNDGSGRFTDVTDSLVDEHSNFGMSHSFADYNLDGRMDFYVIGMASTTMRRLNYMGLTRADFPEYTEMRTRMGYGNRMYLGAEDKTFLEPVFKDSVARSGWSWGITSFDFDSDGDMDVYIANGHLSGKTTQDYCTRFWCHDIYMHSSQEDPSLSGFIQETLVTEVLTKSWDGYQKNHLFMNQSGEDFANVAFLMDVALLEDSRNVLSDDFNLDGRPDLLLTTLVTSGAKKGKHTLLVLQNDWPISNNWIGIRLQEEPGAPSPIGAKIAVKYAGREHIAWIVTGDSFRAQHAPMKHFGLGKADHVDSITVRWPNGTVRRIDNPDINRYHLVRALSDAAKSAG